MQYQGFDADDNKAGGECRVRNKESKGNTHSLLLAEGSDGQTGGRASKVCPGNGQAPRSDRLFEKQGAQLAEERQRLAEEERQRLAKSSWLKEQQKPRQMWLVIERGEGSAGRQCWLVEMTRVVGEAAV